MRLLAAVLLALVTSCGGGDDETGQATTNQIERLSTPKEVRRDPQASARLQPLTTADLERDSMTGAGCNFSRDGRMFLAAVDSNAIVRVGGEIRHLIQSAQVGPSGGFFEDRHLSVSVGRTDEALDMPEEAKSWPARITVTNRRTEVQRRQRGVWTCDD